MITISDERLAEIEAALGKDTFAGITRTFEIKVPELRAILQSLRAQGGVSEPAPVSEEVVERVMTWVRDDVLPAYGITHNSRASAPAIIEGCRAALSKKGGQ